MRDRRILIVGGDIATRDAVAAAMVQLRAEVLLAENGATALEKARAGVPPAVIVLDLDPAHGDEFLRGLRTDPRLEQVPVITMTAGRGAEGAEVVQVPKKPFETDDLRAIVMSLLETV